MVRIEERVKEEFVMKEKWTFESFYSDISYKENKKHAFQRSNHKQYSYRIRQDGKLGIHYQVGEISDEEGFEKAMLNLTERPRDYDFPMEKGVRSRNMVEREISDRELMEIADACMKHLREKYPQYIFHMDVSQRKEICSMINDAGMNYQNVDCAVSVGVSFKELASRDLIDGSFQVHLRDYDRKVFESVAQNYLQNFHVMLDLPRELIMDMPYYGVLGYLVGCLDGESLVMGTSLLSGKVGQKFFSEEFSVEDDVSDKETWFDTFWDGDGCVYPEDKLSLVENGVIVTGYADKRHGTKYQIPHTGRAGCHYSDLPGACLFNPRIRRSQKTVKELLNGKLCVIPVISNGGGFNEKGEYTVPVTCGLLSDGEKVLGRVPPFTMVSNLFDMFGKDYIGVGADNPIFNDKQLLFHAKIESFI